MNEVRKRLEKCPGHGPRLNSRRACLALALGLLFTLSTGLPAAQAQGPVTRCEPEHAYGLVGGEASLCIYVQDIAGMYGADFELSFPGMVTPNPDIAMVVDEDGGTPGVQILRNWTWVPSGWVVFANVADNSIGYLHYLTYGWNPAPAANGSGRVACMRFLGTAAGTFTLSFQPTLNLTGHDLSDRDGWLISNVAHTCAVTFGDPTAVVVSSFAAATVDRTIRVQWETVQEIGILGFNLYRSSTATGGKTRLNQELIPVESVPGSSSGAAYDWTDHVRLRPGRTFFYWLETVDIQGQATLHEPFRVDIEDVAVD